MHATCPAPLFLLDLITLIRAEDHNRKKGIANKTPEHAFLKLNDRKKLNFLLQAGTT
jgi:hypothetical protein